MNIHYWHESMWKILIIYVKNIILQCPLLELCHKYMKLFCVYEMLVWENIGLVGIMYEALQLVQLHIWKMLELFRVFSDTYDCHWKSVIQTLTVFQCVGISARQDSDSCECCWNFTDYFVIYLNTIGTLCHRLCNVLELCQSMCNC